MSDKITPVEFQPYGAGISGKHYVIAEHVTNFWQIDYNGNYGTEIQLSTGKTLRVRDWPHDVAKKLKQPPEQQA